MPCSSGSSGRGPSSPGQTMEASRPRRARWPRRNPWPRWRCQRPKRALAEARLPCHNEVWPGTPLGLGHRNKAAGTHSEVIEKHLEKHMDLVAESGCRSMRMQPQTLGSCKRQQWCWIWRCATRVDLLDSFGEGLVQGLGHEPSILGS